MKPYDATSVCTKCGAIGTTISVSFHGGRRRCNYMCPGYYDADGEHLLRHCGNCHNEWLEAPLDADKPEPKP